MVAHGACGPSIEPDGGERILHHAGDRGDDLGALQFGLGVVETGCGCATPAWAVLSWLSSGWAVLAAARPFSRSSLLVSNASCAATRPAGLCEAGLGLRHGRGAGAGVERAEQVALGDVSGPSRHALHRPCPPSRA